MPRSDLVFGQVFVGLFFENGGLFFENAEFPRVAEKREESFELEEDFEKLVRVFEIDFQNPRPDFCFQTKVDELKSLVGFSKMTWTFTIFLAVLG